MKIEKLISYLEKLNPYTDKSALLLVALVKIAQVGGINRVKAKSTHVHTGDRTVPANVYALTFLPSGSGKDKPLRDIDKNLLPDIIHDFYERAKAYIDRHNDQIVQEATEKYSDSKAEKARFIAANKARTLTYEMADATLEGFIAMREAFYSAGFGSTFVRISEFAAYITSDNNARQEFLDSLTEVFESGDNSPKVIKGEREAKRVDGVPSNAIFHTSLSGLLENGRANNKLMNFLNRGIARRCFVCYPLPTQLLPQTPDEMYKRESQLLKEAKEMEQELKQIFRDFYDKTTEPNCKYHDKNIFELSEESDRRIGVYKAENILKMKDSLVDSENEGLVSEVLNRSWKALRLSALIAAFEHPEEKIVTINDVEYAIRICDYFGRHLERFYEAKPKSNVQKLFEFFLKNEGKFLTKMHIYEERFVNKNSMPKWMRENLPLVEELAEEKGYIIEQEKNGSKGIKYRMIKKTASNLEQEKEADNFMRQWKTGNSK
jgi:hypothetical protein